jgi:hypothetical protein
LTAVATAEGFVLELLYFDGNGPWPQEASALNMNAEQAEAAV